MMKKLQTRTIECLRQQVDDTHGDWSAAESEVSQFQQSIPYRKGLRRAFLERYHHRPNWEELVKFWYCFALRRAKCFRSFQRR